MGLLDEVGHILEQREKQYGPSTDHHRRTAQMWQAAFGWDVDARQVALAIALDKFVRARQSPDDRDHYADIVGYVVKAWDNHTKADRWDARSDG